MKKEKREKEERKIRSEKDKKIGCLFEIIVFLSILPFVYAGRNYYNTFIPLKYILVSSLIIGLIVGTLISNLNQRINGNKLNIWGYYLITSFVCGSYLFTLFFWTNNQFSISESYSIKTPIIEKLETFKYHHNFVKININGFEKDIPVPNEKESAIDNANYIELTLKKGFWGFPIILNKKL